MEGEMCNEFRTESIQLVFKQCPVSCAHGNCSNRALSWFQEGVFQAHRFSYNCTYCRRTGLQCFWCQGCTLESV